MCKDDSFCNKNYICSGKIQPYAQCGSAAGDADGQGLSGEGVYQGTLPSATRDNDGEIVPLAGTNYAAGVAGGRHVVEDGAAGTPRTP